MNAHDAQADSWLALHATARMRTLCEEWSRQPIARGSVYVAQGTLQSRRLALVATDASRHAGALGVEECAFLEATLEQTLRDDLPLVLIIDSAGARITEGLDALGAFRRLYRALLEAVAAAMPVLAVCGHNVFGGASMVASLASSRVMFAATRYAMSGPRIIESVVGNARFNARDAKTIEALLGGAARATTDATVTCMDDRVDSVRQHVATWLAARMHQPATLAQHHDLLRVRLIAHRVDIEQASRRIARTRRSSTDGAVTFRPPLHEPLGAATAWVLADALLAREGDGLPIVVEWDIPSHATTVEDERVVLSDYLAHLARTVLHVSTHERPVHLHIVGAASGGAYVAAAAGAARVSAAPDADIRILPSNAVEAVTNAVDLHTASSGAWLASGVVDDILTPR